MFSFSSPKTFANEIRQNIKRRIYFAILLISMLPFILVFYSFLGFGSIHLILTMFLFAFLLYFLLIPLATEIPQQLILDPIKRIINIIEKGSSQVIGSNHISQYDENKNIELQIMNLISLIKNQSNDAAAGILAKKIMSRSSY